MCCYKRCSVVEFAAGPGAELSRVDCFLLPALYHIKVAGSTHKDFEIPSQFTSLQAYMSTMLESDLV
jgi:hypothetical protein